MIFPYVPQGSFSGPWARRQVGPGCFGFPTGWPYHWKDPPEAASHQDHRPQGRWRPGPAGLSVGWVCSWLAASRFVRQASRSILKRLGCSYHEEKKPVLGHDITAVFLTSSSAVARGANTPDIDPRIKTNRVAWKIEKQISSTRSRSQRDGGGGSLDDLSRIDQSVTLLQKIALLDLQRENGTGDQGTNCRDQEHRGGPGQVQGATWPGGSRIYKYGGGRGVQPPSLAEQHP